MTRLQVFNGNEANSDLNPGTTELDLATIRQRVARIKRKWSPETVKARAVEGARRRTELAALLSGVAGESWELCDQDNCTACV